MSFKPNSLNLLLLLAILLAPICCRAQVKVEREYRISPEQVPQEAVQFVRAIGFSRRIKWYKEETERSTTVEAKSRKEGQKYSIEFNLNGKLEDVEVSMHWRDLDDAVQAYITKTLDAIFKKHRLIKIQKQFVGAPEQLLQFLQNPDQYAPPTTNYELVIAGKEKRSFKKYEFLFNAQGVLIKKTEIVVKNTDHLDN